MIGAAPARPAVSIVITARDARGVIERCLRAAVDQSTPAAELIVVVDARSTDDTAALAHRFAREHPAACVRVLAPPVGPGPTDAYEAGFAAAVSAVIGRIDADTALAHDWVARVGEAMTDADVGAVSGPVSYYDLPFRVARTLSDDLSRQRRCVTDAAHPFLSAGNMAIRADAWRTVEHGRGVDPENEPALSARLRDAGLRVVYDPRLHAAGSSRRITRTMPMRRDATSRREPPSPHRCAAAPA